MFKNKETNQTLLLQKDLHLAADENNLHLDVMSKWKPSLLMIEHDPMIFNQINGFKPHSILSFVGDNNLSIIFADYAGFNWFGIRREIFAEFLDKISIKFCNLTKNIKYIDDTLENDKRAQIFVKILHSTKNNKIKSMENLFIGNDEYQKMYTPNYWYFYGHQRISLTFQYLMGLTKEPFIKYKKIYGLFGAEHIYDIIQWHQSKVLNDKYFPSI